MQRWLAQRISSLSHSDVVAQAKQLAMLMAESGLRAVERELDFLAEAREGLEVAEVSQRFEGDVSQGCKGSAFCDNDPKPLGTECNIKTIGKRYGENGPPLTVLCNPDVQITLLTNAKH